MRRNYLSLITDHFGYKLLSLLIAIVIWYSVVGYNDPKLTESFEVYVRVINESYIESGKQIYLIDDQYKTVTVYVKANQSVLKRITANSIDVTADLTQIVDLNREPVMVPLSVSCSGVDQESLELSRKTIPISIEDIASQEFSVTADTGDTTPDKNYEIGSLKSNVDSVTISGPQSVINTIDTVVARVGVSGISTDCTRNADLVVIKKDQSILSNEIVKDDLTFEGGIPQLQVKIELWKKQPEVALHVNYTGWPADGYQVGEISTVPNTITVVGDEAALKKLAENGNTIEVPEGYVAVDGASQDVTVEVDMTEILPENMRLSSSTGETLTVTVPILQIDSKEFSVDIDRIKTENLDPNLTVSYDQSDFKILVKATDEKLNALKEEDIQASLDLSGLTPGDYTLGVNITLPQEYSLVNEVTIPVHLK